MLIITMAGNIYHLFITCQVLYLFALSYDFISSLQPLYRLDIIIIPALQLRKLGSEKLRNFPKVSQLVSGKASITNPKLPDAGGKPLNPTLFFSL